MLNLLIYCIYSVIILPAYTTPYPMLQLHQYLNNGIASHPRTSWLPYPNSSQLLSFSGERDELQPCEKENLRAEVPADGEENYS